eukprot:TRINITY_DN3080_c0_g1_i10.p1 TRINITY_DN3080_c0_g1~~TRINITY_DN3080_c0_g1_i10.p1  ORF type:complete len:341 (-),score=7.32 TRINITY_DN3080_c0_g1_i10:291-1313(-)
MSYFFSFFKSKPRRSQNKENILPHDEESPNNGVFYGRLKLNESYVLDDYTVVSTDSNETTISPSPPLRSFPQPLSHSAHLYPPSSLLSSVGQDIKFDEHQPRVVIGLRIVDPVSQSTIDVTEEKELRIRISQLEVEIERLRTQYNDIVQETNSIIMAQCQQLRIQTEIFEETQQELIKVQAELLQRKSELMDALKSLKMFQEENATSSSNSNRCTHRPTSNSPQPTDPSQDESQFVEYVCKHCGLSLFQQNHIISQDIVKHGKAHLTTSVGNISYGPKICRRFPTGLYAVLELLCNGCSNVVGWKFEQAFEDRQKYREGKFMITDATLCQLQSQPPINVA